MASILVHFLEIGMKGTPVIACGGVSCFSFFLLLGVRLALCWEKIGEPDDV